jgi:CelD/BcsL family acetyltransferase involved in cellulose biosynthesis
MIESLSISDWRAFDSRHPAPTFFARPAWALAQERAFPHLRAHPVNVRLRNGKRVIVPFVIASGGRLRWRELIGMPLGGYTSALHDDGSLATAVEFSEALSIVRRECDILQCTPWPMGPGAFARGASERMYETSIIDLSKGVDAALGGLTGASRRMAGQSQRRGVDCARSQSGMAPSTYYEMLRAASDRRGAGAPQIPKPLLDALLALGGDDVQIWFAEHLGHPVAGGIVLYGSQELFFWSAAMRPEYAQLRPSNALNVALIRAACERGVRWYNLGASEGLPGVERFKRGLGAIALQYKTLRYERTSYALYSWVRSPFAEKRGAEPVKDGAQ